MRIMFSPTIPQDSPDYLGRLVISYSRVYTVVRIRQSSGRPELFIATPEGEDGRPNGHWVPAGIIAEPYRTIIHWHPSLEFREDPASCETLYQAVLQANEVAPRGRPGRIWSAASGSACASHSGGNIRQRGQGPHRRRAVRR